MQWRMLSLTAMLILTTAAAARGADGPDATPDAPPGERPDGPPGGPAPKGPAPGAFERNFGQGDFGPGALFAIVVLSKADADKDDKLTPEEAAVAAEHWVRDAEGPAHAGLDAAGLAEAMIVTMPAPPEGSPPEATLPRRMFTMLTWQILAAADGDKNGRLSPDEAALAAARFVRAASRPAPPRANAAPSPPADATVASLDRDALARGINRAIGGPGFGGPRRDALKLVKKFDTNGNGRLDREERVAAREFVKKERPAGERRGFGPPGGMAGGPPGSGPPGGFGPPGFGRAEEPVKLGPRIGPSGVKTFPGEPLYAPLVLRTFFLTFEDDDWEAELEEFHDTDVELPAQLMVDGRTYTGVGVHFRGMSSYGMVPAGHKRSLNVSLDFVDPEQRLQGYKTLNLLNSHEDPTFMHTVLYFDIARHYIPAPQANYARVVVNGESWGLYVNAQQFDKKFVEENGGGKGARWKVRGSPGGGGGLEYLGENVADYKRRYEIKSKDNDADWKAFIALCKTLNETPPDRLAEATRPLLDVDGALWFLALDNALINCDGYWIRASDYTIYRDAKSKFHIVPHDANETFQPGMGPGFGGPGRGGPGFGGAAFGGQGRGAPRVASDAGGPDKGRGDATRPDAGPPDSRRAEARRGAELARNPIEIDPLIGLDDPRKPLRSKLLAVPEFREQYLAHVRAIAEKWLDWNTLGPMVARYRELIEPEIAADTRKLSSLAAFERAVADGAETPSANTRSANGASPVAKPGAPSPAEPPRGRELPSLRAFAEAQRAYLLNYPEIKNLPRSPAAE